MAKPTSTPDWTVGNPSFGTVTIEPTSGKKLTGWTSNEKPPFQTFNWLLYNIDQWIKYFDGAIVAGFDVIVGGGNGETHTSLANALADVAVTNGMRFLIRANETINSVIIVPTGKPNLHIEFKPAVTFSKGTSGNGLQIQADGIRIHGGRFAGFSTAGNKAIIIDAGKKYTMIRDTRFASCDTEVDDNGTQTSISGTITE